MRWEVTVEEAATNPPSKLRGRGRRGSAGGDGGEGVGPTKRRSVACAVREADGLPHHGRSRERPGEGVYGRPGSRPGSRTTSRSPVREQEARRDPAAEAWRFWAKRLVEVVFVPVAFVQTRLANEGRRGARGDEGGRRHRPERGVRRRKVRELGVLGEPGCRRDGGPRRVREREPLERRVPVAVSEPTRAVLKGPVRGLHRGDEQAGSRSRVVVNVSDCRPAVPVAVRFPCNRGQGIQGVREQVGLVTEVPPGDGGERHLFQRREAEPKERAASSVGTRGGWGAAEARPGRSS